MTPPMTDAMIAKPKELSTALDGDNCISTLAQCGTFDVDRAH
jgi:hypothetical protein